MSKEKRELRKEVLEFMKDQGHPNKLDLDGNQIPYGIVNHLIASFYELKTKQIQSFPLAADCDHPGVNNTTNKCISCGKDWNDDLGRS